MSVHAESIVLIHGLWMHGLVLVPLQRRLQDHGFAVRRFSYPSWSQPLASNVRQLANFLSALPTDRIHLVAHSLGGLLCLTMLEEFQDERLGRLVLMGSPCAGCHCGRYLAGHPLLSPALGHSMKDWLGRPEAAPGTSVEIGVIAGSRRWGLGRVIPGLPAPNDGVVAVAETRLAAARDSIVLPVSHSGMLFSRDCAGQVASFLRTGRFDHA